MAPPITITVDPDQLFELLLTADAQVRRTLADTTATGADVEAARADTASLAEAIRAVGTSLSATGFRPNPDQLTRVPTTAPTPSTPPPPHTPPSSGSAIRGARLGSPSGPGFSPIGPR